MPRDTFQVFLASNFEEFSSLRTLLRERIDGCAVLPLRCRDLDDGQPRHQRPLHVSLEAVDHSDVLVLFVGRRYGGCPPGETKSYAQLEYEAALDAGDRVVILPYLYGWDSIDAACAAEDERLASWCRALAVEHTLSAVPASVDSIAVADSVLRAIQAAVFDLLTEGQRRALDALDALDVTADGGPSRADLDRLDRLTSGFGDGEEDSISRDEEGVVSAEDALRAPARMAALEQRQQAFRALDLGERAVAVGHLRQALDLLPLDAAAATGWHGCSS